jgi:2-(1,2-epoxy-1,2-dihydrophenyl)acetyl-CoA isomerase
VNADVELAGGQLLHRVDGGVAWIRLNRPDVANSLTPLLRNAVIDLLRTCDEDPSVRVVVLCASGRHFCGGADLRVDHPELDRPEELLSGPETGSVVRMIEYGTHRLVTALLDCQKPIIASVQGTAAGLGVQVALACDLVLMAQEASFIEVFVQRGIVPDGGAAYLLTRLAGLQRAKELMLLGDRVSADKARDYGLATEVVPLDELEARTAELAARLAQGPTVALGMMKRLANRALDSDRATALYEEALAQELVMTSRDAQEGVASFVERRQTDFQGR